MINALIHRDYTYPADIQIRLEDDRIQVWSPGGLPAGIRLEQLKQPGHPSVTRNSLLAQAFYYADLIEKWGSGTTRIIALCRGQGLPDPEFEEYAGGFRVIFYKDAYTPERLRALGLNERQVQAVRYVKERGRIANTEHQKLTGVKKRQASLDLTDLTEKGVLLRVGVTGAGAYYILRNDKGANGAVMGQ